jgi:homoserine O-acetyltransferase/O-succinyltransferase
MSSSLVPTYEGDLQLTAAQPFTLVSGEQLASLKQHYALYGKLNATRDNAILVCHALSGSARVGDWWPQLFDERGIFDLERDCIVCVNVIGSCYGSTGPRDVNPATGELYGADFPLVSVRDWVRAQAAVLDHLGIEKLRAVIGGSIGGMQAMQWAIDFPERVERCLAVGAAPLTALGLALNHLQRQAIRHDPHWLDGRYAADKPPSAGLAQARAIAMCSYKSEHLFQSRYGRQPNRNGEDPHLLLSGRYDIGGYLDYQGEIFTRRFDAASYVVITKAMDNFDPARGYESELAALRRIKARTLLIGISSDWLFPAAEVRTLSERLAAAGVAVEYAELQSTHGHDGFLADADALALLLRKALEPIFISMEAPIVVLPAHSHP